SRRLGMVAVEGVEREKGRYFQRRFQLEGVRPNAEVVVVEAVEAAQLHQVSGVVGEAQTRRVLHPQAWEHLGQRRAQRAGRQSAGAVIVEIHPLKRRAQQPALHHRLGADGRLQPLGEHLRVHQRQREALAVVGAIVVVAGAAHAQLGGRYQLYLVDECLPGHAELAVAIGRAARPRGQ
nr:hypothetical protein [Tanacetum cinerariifolium]